MIYALIIALIGTSAITILLAILATLALRANSRLTREKNAAMRALEEALAGKEALKAENGKLQQELHYVIKERDTNKLQAETSLAQLSDISATLQKVLVRNAVLEEELAAKPTMPAKRVVRKPQTTEEAS